MSLLVPGPGPAELMVVAHQATDHARAAIPATVHVDGSPHPHSVDDRDSTRSFSW